jgi:hypothetical protein
MIDAEAALRAAVATLQGMQREGDPLLRPWGKLSPAAPVLVHDVAGTPSYWLVPFVARDRAVAFARVDKRGRTMAIGSACRTPGDIASCPRVVTGITAEEAVARVRAEGRLAPGEAIAETRYVHDGPPGREVWLVATTLDGRPNRWLFVSRAGVYERPAGARVGENLG